MKSQQIKRSIQIKKGEKAEIIFERSCKELVFEEKILEFIREDLSGQDFILIFPNHKKIKIEVKSSYNGEIFHNIKHKTKIIVVPLKKMEISKKRMEKLVKMTKNKIMELDYFDNLYS